MQSAKELLEEHLNILLKDQEELISYGSSNACVELITFCDDLGSCLVKIFLEGETPELNRSAVMIKHVKCDVKQPIMDCISKNQLLRRITGYIKHKIFFPIENKNGAWGERIGKQLGVEFILQDQETQSAKELLEEHLNVLLKDQEGSIGFHLDNEYGGIMFLYDTLASCLVKIFLEGETPELNQLITILNYVKYEGKEPFKKRVSKKYLLTRITRHVKEKIPSPVENKNGAWGERIGKQFGVEFTPLINDELLKNMLLDKGIIRTLSDVFSNSMKEESNSRVREPESIPSTDKTDTEQVKTLKSFLLDEDVKLMFKNTIANMLAEIKASEQRPPFNGHYVGFSQEPIEINKDDYDFRVCTFRNSVTLFKHVIQTVSEMNMAFMSGNLSVIRTTNVNVPANVYECKWTSSDLSVTVYIESGRFAEPQDVIKIVTPTVIMCQASK